MIIHHAVIHKHTPPAPVLAPQVVYSSTTRHAPTKAKFYVVRPNDTLSKIAARTGVSLGTIEALNPNVNPDTLHPQQKLRLR